MKRFLKNFSSQIYLYIAWIVLSTMFWGWIFNLVTDTVPAKKITVFIEAESVEETELSEKLEEELPEGIKMAQVHSFSYAFFDSQNLLNADVFIVKASNVEQYSGSFAPLPAELLSDGFEFSEKDSVKYGIKVYDAATKTGILNQYAEFGDEDCYLFLGADSVHLEDGAALFAAKRLLSIR